MPPLSRLRRFEEKKLQKRLILMISAIVGIILFFGIFGFRMLVGISLLLDRSSGISVTPTPALLFPPLLDPIPEATNTAKIIISGSAPADTSVLIFVNDTEVKNGSVNTEGLFSFNGIPLKDGKNIITAMVRDAQGNSSQPTDEYPIVYKKAGPALEVNTPESDMTINGGENKYTVNGKVEDQSKVTVNDRFVVLKPDGGFSYTMDLTEGVNAVKVIATDIAGNTTTIERQITYFK